jgi:hypothetical protein
LSRRRKGRDVNGILVIDKPQGVTSNGILQQVKRLFGAAKAGHTGALDPLATGVLPLCFGEATKFSQMMLDSDKAYIATARLGIRTETGDSEGAVVAEKPVPDGLTGWSRYWMASGVISSKFPPCIRRSSTRGVHSTNMPARVLRLSVRQGR